MPRTSLHHLLLLLLLLLLVVVPPTASTTTPPSPPPTPTPPPSSDILGAGGGGAHVATRHADKSTRTNAEQHRELTINPSFEDVTQPPPSRTSSSRPSPLPSSSPATSSPSSSTASHQQLDDGQDRPQVGQAWEELDGPDVPDVHARLVRAVQLGRGKRATGWEPLCGGMTLLSDASIAHTGENAILLRPHRPAAAAARAGRESAAVGASCGAAVMQHVRVLQETKAPLLISAWATRYDSESKPFSLSVVLTFQDGSSSEEVHLFFTSSPANWQNRCIHIEPAKPIHSATIFVSYEHDKGGAIVDDISLHELPPLEPRSLPAASSPDETACRSHCTFPSANSAECKYSDPFYFNAHSSPYEDEATLTTATTYEFLDALLELMENWRGRMSVAYYVQDSVRDIRAISNMRQKHSMVRDLVDFHFMYARSPISYVMTAHPTAHKADRTDEGVPWNMLHELAFRNSQTLMRLRIDIGYVPSNGLREYLTSIVQQGQALSDNNAAEVLGNRVFVLPDVHLLTSLDKDVTEPTQNDFDELLSMSKNELVSSLRSGSIASQFFAANDGLDASVTSYNPALWAASSMPTRITPATFDSIFSPFFFASGQIPSLDASIERGPSGARYDLDVHYYRMQLSGLTIHLLPEGFLVRSLQPSLEEHLPSPTSAKTARLEWIYRRKWLRLKKTMQEMHSAKAAPGAAPSSQVDVAQASKYDDPTRDVTYFQELLVDKDIELNQLRQSAKKVPELESRIRQANKLLEEQTGQRRQKEEKLRSCQSTSKECRSQLRELNGVARRAANYRKQLSRALSDVARLRDQVEDAANTNKKLSSNNVALVASVAQLQHSHAELSRMMFRVNTFAMVALVLGVGLAVRAWITRGVGKARLKQLE